LSKRSPALYLSISILAYFALWLLIPKAKFLPAIINSIDAALRHASGPFAAVLCICGAATLALPTILFMVVQVSIIYSFSKLRMNFWQALLCLVGCLAGVAAIVMLIIALAEIPTKLHRYPTMREIWFIMGLYRHPLKMPMYVLLMLAASSIGYLVSLRIRDKNLLLPVVIFAAFTDFWTVTVGPVASVVKHAPEIVSAVSAPIPKAGTGAFMPSVMMGMGDPLFMALVFAAVHRLGMNSRRNFIFVTTMMTVAMVLVMLGVVPYLPALAALAIAVIAGNWREFKLSRQEKISTGIVALVLLATLPLIWHIVKEQHKPAVKEKAKAAVASPLEQAPR